MCFDLHYFISVFPSQFSAPFCPEKLNNFLFLAVKQLPCWRKMPFSAVPSCCIPEASFPDRSSCNGTEAGWGAAGVLLLIAGTGRGCQGPAGPPQCPQGGLGRTTRRAPASGGTSQPAKSPQSRGADCCCQISCPYALRGWLEALQHRLSIQPLHSGLHCHIGTRFAVRRCSLLHHRRMQCLTLDEVKACSFSL